MNQRNNHQNAVITSGYPLGMAAWAKRRDPKRFDGNEGSLVLGAIITARAKERACGNLRSLGRNYDAQARDNFIKEAVLFSLIVIAGGVWPVLQSLRAMLDAY